MINRPHRSYHWKDGKVLKTGERSLVMGILNVTPDSFSDGGKWNSSELSLAHTKDMITDGADIIDVGAESTRPGHVELTADEETERLMTFLPSVLEASTVPVSVDSYHYETMEAALKHGAHMVNDIWGFQYDDGSMAKVSAAFDVPVILMHNQKEEGYSDDIIEDLKRFFDRSLEIALKAGVREENIILDPGIGFSKNTGDNMKILVRLDELVDAFSTPWLLGVSRKRFIGAILDTAADERDEGTAAVNLWGALKGCDIYRVHDVKTTARELRMWDALSRFKE